MKIMIIKNKKMTSRTNKTIWFIVLVMTLLVPMSLMSGAYAEIGEINITKIDQVCIEKASDSAHKIASQLDENKIKTLVNTNTEFKSRTQGYDVSSESVFNDWQIDTITCEPTLQGVNIVYFLNDTNGYAKNLVFNINPEINKVTKIDEYISDFYLSSKNWDGYEFFGNAGATTSVYEAKVSYIQKTMSQPPSGQPNCVSKPCDASTWVGLEDISGGTNAHLVQSGTSGRVVCSTSSCTTSYFMWYEFLPTAAVFCSGTVNMGDSVLVDIVNQAKTGGSSTKYNISSATTSGAMCTVTGQTYTSMSNPTRSAFITERACQTGCTTATPTFYSQAKFTSPTLQGWLYYGTSLKSISVPWSAGFKTEVKMDLNASTPNITHSTTPASIFNQIWQHSNGT